MEEAIKGGKNDVRVAMIRAHLLTSELGQVCILGIDGSFIN